MTENEKRTPAPPPEDTEQTPYTPRPKWQIVMAWIALAIVITGLILYYYNIMFHY